jgi:hypothetical protein
MDEVRDPLEICSIRVLPGDLGGVWIIYLFF